MFEDILLPAEAPTTHIDIEYPVDENVESHNHSELVNIMKELVDANLKEEITFKSMVGGVTNTLFKSSFITGQGNNKSVIIRLYGKGSEQFIDRKQEAYIQYLLSKNGVGPQFYGTFNNGCVYGYVEGDQLQLEDLESKFILDMIGDQVARWHSLDFKLNKTPMMVSNIHSWIQTTEALVCTNSMIDIDVEYYKKESLQLLDFLQNQYSSSLSSPHIKFCHNDLIPRNMIYNRHREVVKFIDFEYSGYNYRGYDIGNFFCEFSGLDLDYTKYPSVSIQKQFIKHYLESLTQLKQHQNNNNNNNISSTSSITNEKKYEASEEEIHQLYIEANHFSLGSHLMWGFWGIVQHFSSSIEFDYLDYSRKRFKQYDLVKKKVLNLK
ncbi:hypothetical protein CYY_004532 [Polysphondylium violaceum]|uniref:ethanolamine kinase n=1 Tax=Polysphondylium violaceum TaxID=133409 RepID=A0A8J4USY3_9MYCE|nr:hypothetical protein CYY_004532 [Polysphondylium violaceum]